MYPSITYESRELEVQSIILKYSLTLVFNTKTSMIQYEVDNFIFRFLGTDTCALDLPDLAVRPPIKLQTWDCHYMIILLSMTIILLYCQNYQKISLTVAYKMEFKSILLLHSVCPPSSFLSVELLYYLLPKFHPRSPQVTSL